MNCLSRIIQKALPGSSQIVEIMPYLVRNTYNNLFRLFSAPYGTRSPHRSPRTLCKARRLLGGGFRPMEPGCVSPAPRSRSRQEKMAGNAHRCPVGGALSPSVTGPSSRCPVAPFATWWRRGNAMWVIRSIRSCDTLTRHSNTDGAMPTSSS